MLTANGRLRGSLRPRLRLEVRRAILRATTALTQPGVEYSRSRPGNGTGGRQNTEPPKPRRHEAPRARAAVATVCQDVVDEQHPCGRALLVPSKESRIARGARSPPRRAWRTGVGTRRSSGIRTGPAGASYGSRSASAWSNPGRLPPARDRYPLSHRRADRTIPPSPLRAPRPRPSSRELEAVRLRAHGNRTGQGDRARRAARGGRCRRVATDRGPARRPAQPRDEVRHLGGQRSQNAHGPSPQPAHRLEESSSRDPPSPRAR